MSCGSSSILVWRSQSPIQVHRVSWSDAQIGPVSRSASHRMLRNLYDAEEPSPLPHPLLHVEDRAARGDQDREGDDREQRRQHEKGTVPATQQSKIRLARRVELTGPSVIAVKEPQSEAPGGVRRDRPVVVEDGPTRCSAKVEPAGIHEDPMHGDVGIDKLSQLGRSAGRTCPRPPRRHGWRGPVDQLVEAIDVAQHRYGVGLGMEGQDGGCGAACSSDEDDRRRRSRRSAVRSTGSPPAGGSGTGASRRAPTSNTRLRGAAADLR